jgi:hypothetical protein
MSLQSCKALFDTPCTVCNCQGCPLRQEAAIYQTPLLLNAEIVYYGKASQMSSTRVREPQPPYKLHRKDKPFAARNLCSRSTQERLMSSRGNVLQGSSQTAVCTAITVCSGVLEEFWILFCMLRNNFHGHKSVTSMKSRCYTNEINKQARVKLRS